MGGYGRRKINRIQHLAIALTIASLVGCTSCGKNNIEDIQHEAQMKSSHSDDFVKLKQNYNEYTEDSDRETFGDMLVNSDNIPDTIWQDTNIGNDENSSNGDNGLNIEPGQGPEETTENASEIGDSAIVQVDSNGNIINNGDKLDNEIVGIIEPNISEIDGYYDYIQIGETEYDKTEFGIDIGMFIQNTGNKQQYIADALAYICKTNDIKLSSLRNEKEIKTTSDFKYQILTFYSGRTEISLAISDTNQIKYMVRGVS